MKRPVSSAGPACAQFKNRLLGVALAVGATAPAAAQDSNGGFDAGTVELPEIEVVGRGQDLTGIAESAAQGRVSQAQFAKRPVLRPAEVLEVIPGLIATQHSGTGKANQYFLRGFNLDHGTDFAAAVDGVPINLPTHGHGQGYLDLNFLIPELVQLVEFKKGPYYAEVGDFASAGSAQISLVDRLPRGILEAGIGLDNFYRAVVADSPELGDGHLLYGLEAQYYDGPWDNPENGRKFNGILKHTTGNEQGGFSLSGLAYYSQWDSTDQIARRAVDGDLISRFDTLDPTDGGESERYTLNAQWWDASDTGVITRANVFGAYYRLNLFSNFTYFLDNPVNGDQFEQADRRAIGGASASREWLTDWFGGNNIFTLGAQLRHDQIFQVGLFRTTDRERLSTVRDDEVTQTSLGVYADLETQWNNWFRTIAGLREDVYRFDVDSSLQANSGNETDAIASPKLSLILGPWYDTEYYLNLGYGYHSNDARGTTIQIDPTTVDPDNPDVGAPADPVDPLVRSKGAEVGARTVVIPNLNSTLSLWYLELDSELLFVGDAGTTEPSRPSERYGVEWTNFYGVTDWLTLDFDVALSEARFTDDDPAGDEIPGAIDRVISAGATVDFPNGVFGALRLRHFGPRPLIEDGSQESDSTSLVNLKAGYRFTDRFSVELDVLNVLDAEDDDITYFYASRLAGEPAAGVEDEHFHPVEPVTARLYATWRF